MALLSSGIWDTTSIPEFVNPVPEVAMGAYDVVYEVFVHSDHHEPFVARKVGDFCCSLAVEDFLSLQEAEPEGDGNYRNGRTGCTFWTRSREVPSTDGPCCEHAEFYETQDTVDFD